MPDIPKQQEDAPSNNEEPKAENKRANQNAGQETIDDAIPEATSKIGDESKSDRDHELRKPKNKDREEEQSITEINLDQTNISGSAEKQENKADLNFYKKIGRLSIEIKQDIKQIESKLRFHELRRSDYLTGLNPSEKAFVRYQVDTLLPLLAKRRLAVINNDLPGEDMVMAVIESIVFNPAFSGRVKAQSCQRNDPAFTLDEIINRFLEHKNKQNDKIEHCFLVIYEKPGETSNTYAFLSALLKKGGAADSITNVLQDENVFVLCVTSDTSLYKKAIQDRAHFVLIHLSEIHQLLFDNISHRKDCQNISALVETALSEYDWLASLSMAEKKDIIIQLIQDNKIASFLTELIKSVDREEATVINNLLKGSVQGIVMFTTAFFEEVTIDEFDGVIRLLANEQGRLIKSQGIDGSNFDPGVTWETSGDDILAVCGISRKQTSDGKSAYCFASKARHENTRKIFIDNYSLTLMRRFELIEDRFFLKDQPLSEKFLKGVFELAMLNAQNNQVRYTIDVCVKIVDQLTEKEETDDLSFILFNRLLYFIRNWSVNAEQSSQIRNFYHQMTQTRKRRGILGALLTYLCEPLQIQNLSCLKALLDACGDDEEFVNVRVPRIIANNFKERLTDLFVVIENWLDNADDNYVPRSYAFTKFSLLLIFYENRFSSNKAGNLEKALIETLHDSRAVLSEYSLIKFTFSTKVISAFYKVFDKIISTQVSTSDSRHLKKIQENSLFSFYGFILIRWYYLLTLFSGEDKHSLKSAEELVQKALRVIHALPDEKSSQLLQSALMRAVKKYNVLIVQSKEHPGESFKKESYKTRRDIARKLIQLSEQVDNLKQQAS